MPKGIRLSEEELNTKRHEIFAAAARLFMEKGFLETSMREVAQAAGMGKSSLYDYFKSKDEILIWFYLDELEDTIVMTRGVMGQDLPATETLRRILHAQLARMLENKAFYLRFLSELDRLGAESQRRIRTARHSFQDLLREVIEQGIREGAFRPVAPLLAAHILQMVLLPAVFTSRPVATPAEMLDEAIGIFLQGVQRSLP